jgi:V8-like Glu-specific endopeptidase
MSKPRERVGHEGMREVAAARVVSRDRRVNVVRRVATAFRFMMIRRTTGMANAAENESIGSACGAGGDRNESSAQEYWIEARRARAKPVPMPKAWGDEWPVTTGEALPKGPPGHTPGQAPSSRGDENNLAPHLEAPGPGAHPVPRGTVYPYSAVGKLTFSRGGNELFGSAALISPNVLLTAGHCVYRDDGGWSANPVFYPSFGWRAETDPAYKFNCSYLACRTAWYRNSTNNVPYDYGMLWIDAAPGNLTGISWLGYAWGQSTDNRTWTAVGYPGDPDPPFNGNTMEQAVGQLAFSADTIPGVIALTNDNMEEGSSGGPWITAWGNDTFPAHANGVTSKAGKMIGYSPYFTHEVNDLFNWISNPANRHPRPPPWPPHPRR